MLIIVVMQRTTNNSLALGGFRMFSVATGSMVPVYNVGDILPVFIFYKDERYNL